MNQRRLFLIVFFVLCFMVTSKAQAATSNLLGSASIEISPDYPKPGQRTLANVVSNSLDLERTEIIWLVNGSVVKQGIGEKSIGFNVGKAGTQTKIEVKINSQSLGQLTNSITINPADVDLLWESNSYTPLLYNAKPLHSSESQITLLAIPHVFVSGAEVSSKDLIYNWKVNGNPMVNQSGYGKNSFSYKGPKIFGSDTIEVVASTKDSLVYASNRVDITTINPEIIFYEENSLYGTNYAKTIPRALGLVAKEYKVRAEPFYFTETDINTDKTKYIWTLNGEEIKLNSDPRILTMRHTGGSGSSNIELAITNSARALQEASASFDVYFGKNI